jgi:predicted alpha/beta-fold hydrolase
VAFAVNHIASRHPSSPIILAGASLGGNVLLKFLGEQGVTVFSRVAGAVAISVPFDLAKSSRHIDRGFARVYQRHFIRSLRRKAKIKLRTFPDLVNAPDLARARTMFDFDDVFTAPVHGFAGAMDYYTKSSSLNWLERISVPTLLLSAVDDPFLPPQVLNEVRQVANSNPSLDIEFTPHGGQVGFVEGASPFSPSYYLERRTGDFLAAALSNYRE